MVWWWPRNRDTLWKCLPCSPRQLCVPSPVQSLARAHTCAHTPQGDCSCYVEKSVALQIAQGESDVVGGYAACMDQAVLISLYKRMNNPQQVKARAALPVSSCQHCWPFPARHGTHPYHKSCLFLPQNWGTSSAFVRSHWCKVLVLLHIDHQTFWPSERADVAAQVRVTPCRTQPGVSPPPEIRCSRKNTWKKYKKLRWWGYSSINMKYQ